MEKQFGVHNHTMGYYSAIKGNRLLIHTTGMNFKNIMPKPLKKPDMGAPGWLSH